MERHADVLSKRHQTALESQIQAARQEALEHKKEETDYYRRLYEASLTDNHPALRAEYDKKLQEAAAERQRAEQRALELEQKYSTVMSEVEAYQKEADDRYWTWYENRYAEDIKADPTLMERVQEVYDYHERIEPHVATEVVLMGAMPEAKQLLERGLPPQFLLNTLKGYAKPKPAPVVKHSPSAQLVNTGTETPAPKQTPKAPAFKTRPSSGGRLLEVAAGLASSKSFRQ